MGFKALTLVEILITVSIIIILSLIGVLGYTNFRPYFYLVGTSREIVADLRLSQQLSVGGQEECGICFLINENSYQVLKYNNHIIIKEKELPGEIFFDRVEGLSENCVFFNSFGAVLESGSIVLTNIKSEKKTIEVKPSGFLKIE